MSVLEMKFVIWRALPAVVLAGGAVMVLTMSAAAESAQGQTRAAPAGATGTMTSKVRTAAGMASGKAGAQPSAAAIAREAALVHRSAIVIDTHADTPQRFLDEHYDLGDALKGGELNLESARKGGLGAEFFSIWVEPEQYKGHYARRTLELIDAVKQQVAKHPKEMVFVASPEGIEWAHRQHKLAALMGIEGGHSIEDKCRENDHSTPFIKSSGLKSKPGWFYTFRTGLKLNSIRFSPLPTCPFLPRC